MKTRMSNRRSSPRFRILPVIVAMAAAGLAQPVLAVDRTYVGGIGNWDVAEDWSPAGVPGSSDKVIINDSLGPTLSFDTTIQSLDFRTGVLRGVGTLSITGPSTWRDGVFTGEGTTQFLGDLSITGSPDKELLNGWVVSVNDTTWGNNTAPNSNAILLGGGTTIGNNGTWNDTNAFDSSIASGGSFHNLGTYNKQGNAVTTIGNGVSYQNTGTTNVDAGTMRIANSFENRGVIAVDTGATFQVSGDDDTTFSNAEAGTIQGGGTVITPTLLTNSGVINPGDADAVGHLTIDGDLHQAESGALNFGLASVSNFDQLTVTDDVTWGGELIVSNMGYTPVVGDSFVIATFDERLTNSQFSSVTMDGFGPGAFNVTYGDHNVILSAVPEPESWAMLLAGLGLMGALTRRRRA